MSSRCSSMRLQRSFRMKMLLYLHNTGQPWVFASSRHLSTLSHERVYELISCVSNPDASAPQLNHEICRVFAMKMEEDGFQLGAHQELQPDHYQTLASLCLTEEAAVISQSTDHMADNPEPHSRLPGMMSSPIIQSKQQKESTDVEPCPAVHGKAQWAIDPDILVITAQ